MIGNNKQRISILPICRRVLHICQASAALVGSIESVKYLVVHIVVERISGTDRSSYPEKIKVNMAAI